jgi:hypothetical protein
VINPLLLIHVDRVCQPFAVDIDPDVDAWRGYLTYKIEQNGRHIGMLFVCYIYGKLESSARFIMWDVITQAQVAVGSFLSTYQHLPTFRV